MDTSRSMRLASCLVAALMASSSLFAQQSSAAPAPAAPVSAGSASSVVPHLVNYSGVLQDASGKSITDIRGVTFLLYQVAQGGAPVWMETQNVTPDKSGHYTVQLGATRSEGLPASVFITGERWLAVQVSGEAEQPRVLLVAVPYALKAADAETVGGLPPSAFVLAAPPSGSGEAKASDATASTASAEPPASSNVTTTGGTVNAVPLWTTKTNIQSSAISQTGSGTTAKVGIGTSAPATTLDVKGAETIRGALTLPATGTATATAGKNSQPQDLVASSFNSSTSTAVNQTFQWQAEPAANNTGQPSGTLNLLYGLGATKPGETGLKLSNKGLFTFAKGQTFRGTGTITGVTAGTGLTGGGTSGNVALSLLTTCASGQVLQWNGTTWVCTRPTGGTVTSVGLSAPSSDFTVSGSPVTTTGTLNLAWKAAPTSADTANAIVKRDGTGSFNVTNITGTGTFATTTANSQAIYGVTPTDGGTAIVGAATATGGSYRVYGVLGQSYSTVAGSTGVLGEDMNTTGTGGFTIGVQGFSSNPKGIGVLGLDASLSAAFSKFVGNFPVGVWGDGGTSNGIGVRGTADDGEAGEFSNDSSAGAFTLVATALGSSSPFLAMGPNGGYCTIGPNGTLGCTGTKNAVVPIYGGKRKVAMSAIESPQNWFEDFGSAQLSNGSAVVALDPDFIETVNTSTHYMVIPVPNGECKGLYITHKTPVSFEVRELGGGTSNIAFDYRIVVLRKNYEGVRFADHTNDPDPRKMMEEMKQRRKNATTAPVGSVSAKESPLLRPAISQ